jgi:hypothetical protein
VQASFKGRIGIIHSWPVNILLARLYSFKFIIGAALLWLGVLAYGLAIYSTYVYRDHAIETQLQTLETQLEREASEARRT